jgi:hypothetical protein
MISRASTRHTKIIFDKIWWNIMKIGTSMTPPKAKLRLELLISCHQQHQRDIHANLCECRDLPVLNVPYTAEIFVAIKMCDF